MAPARRPPRTRWHVALLSSYGVHRGTGYEAATTKNHSRAPPVQPMGDQPDARGLRAAFHGANARASPPRAWATPRSAPSRFSPAKRSAARSRCSTDFRTSPGPSAPSRVLMFLIGLPIAYYAAKYGVDIDLLTRGAGFGYMGSTVTSLIYASFTFLLFAIEASIMSVALNLVFDIPMWLAHICSSLVVIPIALYGISLISKMQIVTQPIWLILQFVPIAIIAWKNPAEIAAWTQFGGTRRAPVARFNFVMFGLAASVLLSLLPQIGEQVDYLRFLPNKTRANRVGWWTAVIGTGPGWVLLGGFKLLIGSFLAVCGAAPGRARHAGRRTDDHVPPRLPRGVPVAHVRAGADRHLRDRLPAQDQRDQRLRRLDRLVELLLAAHAFASRAAWSGWCSTCCWRCCSWRSASSAPSRASWSSTPTSRPGGSARSPRISSSTSRWASARSTSSSSARISTTSIRWASARWCISVVLSSLAFMGVFGQYAADPLAVRRAVRRVRRRAADRLGHEGQVLPRAPGRPACRRKPPSSSARICENVFERGDIAMCPAYSGPICSLCCTLEARCRDQCKTNSRFNEQLDGFITRVLPKRVGALLNTRAGHFGGLLLLSNLAIGLLLALIYQQYGGSLPAERETIRTTLWLVYFALLVVSGVMAWLIVLAHESRRAAEAESARQTAMLMDEIDAHKRTDAALQKAKEVAEAANVAKTRYIAGICARDPHAAQFHLRLRAAARARRRRPLRQRDPRDPPQRRASGRSHRRHPRHLEDRERHPASEPRQGAAGGVPRPDRRHVPAAGGRQGHRIRLQRVRPTSRRSCTSTRSGCARSSSTCCRTPSSTPSAAAPR